MCECSCQEVSLKNEHFIFPKGKLWLDAPEPSAYRGPIHYTSINQETWYSVSMTGIVSESIVMYNNLTNGKSEETDCLKRPCVSFFTCYPCTGHGFPR